MYPFHPPTHPHTMTSQLSELVKKTRLQHLKKTPAGAPAEGKRRANNIQTSWSRMQTQVGVSTFRQAREDASWHVAERRQL